MPDQHAQNMDILIQAESEGASRSLTIIFPGQL